MNREEAESCIRTIEMLETLAYNVHGVMDIIDAQNCKDIVYLLKEQAEMTRCKDCIHHNNSNGVCVGLTLFTSNDEYCSRARRKEAC